MLAVTLHADQPTPLEVAKHPEIESLSMRLFRDSDIPRLLRLKRLTQLRIARTAVSDEGMKVLGQLVSLRLLDLTGTRVSSEGIECIKDLSHLDSLFVNDTDVDDHAMRSIASHAELRVLHVGNKVTSYGLKALSGLRKLEELVVPAGIDDECSPPCDRFRRFDSSVR